MLPLSHFIVFLIPLLLCLRRRSLIHTMRVLPSHLLRNQLVARSDEGLGVRNGLEKPWAWALVTGGAGKYILHLSPLSLF